MSYQLSIEASDGHFMVCTGCLVIIADDDAAGLDCSLSEEDAADRVGGMWAIEEVLRSERLIAVGDSDKGACSPRTRVPLQDPSHRLAA